MPHVEADVDTKLAADRVIAAFIDFSERRPDIWKGTTGDSVTVTVDSVGSGSRLQVVWDRYGKTAPAKVMLGVISLFMGAILRRYYSKTLDGIAEGTRPAR